MVADVVADVYTSAVTPSDSVGVIALAPLSGSHRELGFFVGELARLAPCLVEVDQERLKGFSRK